MRKLMLLATAALAGCAQNPPDWTQGPSYVSGIYRVDGPALSQGIVELVHMRVAGPGPVAVQDAQGSVLEPSLTDQLGKNGYPVQPDAAHKISYVIQPLGKDGTMLLAVVDDAVGTRLYARDPKTNLLRPKGPFSVREPAVP